MAFILLAPLFPLSLAPSLLLSSSPCAPLPSFCPTPRCHPLPPSLCVSVPGGGLKIPVLSPWHTYKCTAHTQTQLAGAQVFQGESRSPAPEERGLERVEESSSRRRRTRGVGGGQTGRGRDGREGVRRRRVVVKSFFITGFIFHCRVLPLSTSLYFSLSVLYSSRSPPLIPLCLSLSSLFPVVLSLSHFFPPHLSLFLSPYCLNSSHPLSVSLSFSLVSPL